ncbi:DNA polymerase III subunit gamma/tau [Wenzhouxiangella limi]|uniref:DNA polymerase III subunit gamma/tau n=1 Tax=Wenzhouxiangella limi TaxID=2707351 RepID=A0A845V2B5_9GAMM|nr:DNA polymerase III subunit gamma/tau [Wenzhouxiangella limi]NDY96854.1 DNA polymerase III subunit gamma/tau [Wenzhouxiangella limi]
MSYQVLARKWRPRDFAGLVGQSHVVQVLGNGLASGRIHHAFLFTGTRGVGKTTIARILAKSLNCVEGVTAEPCGVCENCVAIDEGRFVDLLEIDAASRTKVDDTREILDNVQYAPARGRFKVYLIDEVHMLSTHSFNALLKTLEEPPEHVKFVLATTDPQKIPVTILSRCLQFNLRRLQTDEIAGQMRQILAAEEVEAEGEAVSLLARAADGSMRDGLSLLDQALAAGEGLSEKAVRDMLGSVEQRHIHQLLQALAERQPGAAIAAIGEVFGQARSLSRLLQDLAEALHRIALIQQLPDYRDDSRADWEELTAMAARLDSEDVQLYYQIAVTGRRDLHLAPTERSGCEMTLLRMFAFAPMDNPDGSASGRSSAPGRPIGEDARGLASAASGAVDAAPKPVPSPEDSPGAVAEGGSATPSSASDAPVLTAENWPALLARLGLNGSVRTVAALLAFSETGDGYITFTAGRDDLFMMTERFKAALTSALSAHLGYEVRVSIRAVDEVDLDTPARREQSRRDASQAEAEDAIDKDPLVQRLRSRFDAEVLRDSIRPLDTRSH